MAREASVTALASKSGKTGRSIRANGRIIRRMEKARSGTPMATTMKVNFATINQMDTVSSTARMARCMKAFGTMTFSTERGKRTGQTAQATLGTMWRDAAMALAPTNGQTAIHIAANGRTMP